MDKENLSESDIILELAKYAKEHTEVKLNPDDYSTFSQEAIGICGEASLMVHSSTVDISGVGQVIFERSKKAKRLNISVKPSTGVRVAVPDGLSFQKAEEFVYTKKTWIQKHLVRMKQYEETNRINSIAPDDIDRAKAKPRLKRRLKYLAEKHGFTYNRVFIRNQKTRWGSCSNKNNIGLNVRTVQLPEELMDYVILHELAHTKIKNHSDDFWSMMNKLVGDGKGKAAKLRESGIGYL